MALTHLTFKGLGRVVNRGLKFYLEDVLPLDKVFLDGQNVADKHVLGGGQEAAVEGEGGDGVDPMEVQFHVGGGKQAGLHGK